MRVLVGHVLENGTQFVGGQGPCAWLLRVCGAGYSSPSPPAPRPSCSLATNHGQQLK